VDEAGQPKRCDWDTNWGVLMMWYTREDQKAWDGDARSRIAFEFRSNLGHYRLVAHRAGDPARRAYCVGNYRSGLNVAPSDFEDCWNSGGSRLTDFTKIDYFALQLLSEEPGSTSDSACRLSACPERRRVRPPQQACCAS